ncbi:XRE family transcriptional regulator [Pseudomonas duriflava]|uniref:XRE family transcriptional regulator n=1 Tax=Pseudomonas duriflava TaxID=459528 RepID=A0A562QL29_9PSED|nr:XRE family transcriptional regulator [Pseudomonas duriflava]TWI57451.1 XRE family transcriptional regulator [Pseudomonas duriflava]
MDVLEHVAENLRRLRIQAGFSQQALAERSGVSRRMLVSIESGDSNVSLNTLDRLAEALGVKFKELVLEASAHDARQVGAVVWKGEKTGSQGVLLGSCPARSEVELWEWRLMPGERYISASNPAGWQEMFIVVEGQLVLEQDKHEQIIKAGECFSFSGDANRYAYRNDSSQPVRFIRNVIY